MRQIKFSLFFAALLLFLSFNLTSCGGGGGGGKEIGPETIFDFETDHEGWVTENSNMTTEHNTDANYIYHGVGSIAGHCNITGADPDTARVVFRYGPVDPIDFTGRTLEFHVYIPDSLASLSNKYGSKLWLYTTGWVEIEGPEIDTAGWNAFTFTPSGVGEESVTVVAIQIYKNDGTEDDWSGDIYFDYFNW